MISMMAVQTEQIETLRNHITSLERRLGAPAAQATPPTESVNTSKASAKKQKRDEKEKEEIDKEFEKELEKLEEYELEPPAEK